MTTPFRRRVELATGPALVLVSRLPRFVPFLAILGLLIGGLLFEGVAGAVLLGLLALLMGGLLFLAWPALDSQGRVIRSAVIALVAVEAFLRAL